MPAKGIRLSVSEYHILDTALKCYREALEKLSATAIDEDQQLQYDERLQDIEGLLKAIQLAAMTDYQLKLD